MELNFASRSMQIPTLKIPHKPGSIVSSVRFSTQVGCTQPMAYSQVYRPTIFVSSRKFRGYSLRLRHCARFDDFCDRDMSKDDKRSETPPPCHDDTKEKNEKSVETKMQIFPSKFEWLDPRKLGINPEPPSWPEREEICVTLSIEQKASHIGWKEGFLYVGGYAYSYVKVAGEYAYSYVKVAGKHVYSAYCSVRGAGDYVYSAYYSAKDAGESACFSVKDAGESAYCSVKKAFSSLVFIIQELHNQTWQIKENLQCEELRVILTKTQDDINSMFLWLFKQVFSKTPTLMLYVVLLLANFSVHSINTQQQMFNKKAIAATTLVQEEESEEGLAGSDRELGLLKSVMKEASTIQEENFKVANQQILQNLFVKVDSGSIANTNSLYQINIAKEPDNPLLMVNYAMFLCKVLHDNDRAEEWFKRAVELETADAYVFGQYADFLWNERHDEQAAEEKFNQAYEAEPESSNYHKASYANFLWRTGAEDTCFPLSYVNDKS